MTQDKNKTISTVPLARSATVNPVRTIRGVGILCYYRDQLNQQASSLLEEADKELSAAKAAYHDKKIRSNQLKKQALMVQEAINAELELELNKQQVVEEAYRIKSKDEL